MSEATTGVHLGVALDGAGWHPAAWREPDARPTDLFTGRYWTELAVEAERGLLDLITIEDAFHLQSDDPFLPDDRADRVKGRLDAVLIAARVAPLTRHLGLVPTAIATHTEPFHLSKAIATLDYASLGRAGVRIQVSARADDAAHFGRRSVVQPTTPQLAAVLAGQADPSLAAATIELFDEAADYVEVLRRLWDSWEDDAVIRDVATGRFVDRDKLHYIDFSGRWFLVRGPSITPRPPQGQPIVAALGHAAVPYRLIGRSADLGFITPQDADQAAAIIAAIRDAQADAGRADQTVHVWADLSVVLDDSEAAAVERLHRLDETAGGTLPAGARVFAGTPSGLADLIADWTAAGRVAGAQTGLTGFRLRPAVLPTDLLAITRGLVPTLQRRGLFRAEYRADSLRGLLDLPRPASRYAAA